MTHRTVHYIVRAIDRFPRDPERPTAGAGEDRGMTPEPLHTGDLYLLRGYSGVDEDRYYGRAYRGPGPDAGHVAWWLDADDGDQWPWTDVVADDIPWTTVILVRRNCSPSCALVQHPHIVEPPGATERTP